MYALFTLKWAMKMSICLVTEMYKSLCVELLEWHCSSPLQLWSSMKLASNYVVLHTETVSSYRFLVQSYRLSYHHNLVSFCWFSFLFVNYFKLLVKSHWIRIRQHRYNIEHKWILPLWKCRNSDKLVSFNYSLLIMEVVI